MSAHLVAEWIKKAEDNYQSALTLMRVGHILFPTLSAINVSSVLRNIRKLFWFGIECHS